MIKNSVPCTKSELDLFYTLPTNTSIIRSKNVRYPCQSSLKGDEKKIEISITAGAEYTDLNEVYLELEIEIPGFSQSKVKIIGDMNETSEEDTDCSVINNFGHSLFDCIELTIVREKNFKTVESEFYYHYKAYLLNLLNFSEDVKNTYLQNGIWEKDEAEKFEDKSNQGYINRRKIFLEGKEKSTLIFPLHLDFLNSNRFLIPQTELKFILKRNEDKFVLMGSHYDSFKVKIKDANIWARRCEISQSVLNAHEHAITSSPVKYPIKQNRIIQNYVEKGISNFTAKTFLSYIPNKIVAGFVLDSSFNGDHKNPYNFQHFDVSEVILTVDSKNYELRMNAADNDCTLAYHSIFQSLNIFNQGSIGVTKKDFMGGNCFFCFNLNPDKGCDEQFNQLVSGNVYLTFKFSKQTPEKLRLISLLEYDNQININNKGEIDFDYYLS